VVESSFIYTDDDRGHYIAVEPPGTENLAPLIERHRRVFDRCFAEGPPEVQELGLRLRRRLVVGLDRLREKLRLWDADLDDRVVEALKGDVLAELNVACGSVYFVDLLPAGHFVLGLYQGARPTVPPRAATHDPGCLMTVTVTAPRYRERAADLAGIATDYPRLAEEWLVDVSAT